MSVQAKQGVTRKHLTSEDVVRSRIITSVKDPDKLLQEMDVNRLRAVIYRDVVSYLK